MTNPGQAKLFRVFVYLPFYLKCLGISGGIDRDLDEELVAKRIALRVKRLP